MRRLGGRSAAVRLADHRLRTVGLWVAPLALATALWATFLPGDLRFGNLLLIAALAVVFVVFERSGARPTASRRPRSR